ncbi:eukaryotic aspartyl protease [Diplocarpon rosae]|nr:eukaryotic aspartyl protease [Diplocarpon rosae]
MGSRWPRALGIAALIARCVESTVAAAATALSVPPSQNWYGDDGFWSAVSIRVGTPAQWADVFVSTVSSETWVVGSGGCESTDTHCAFIRGGTIDPSQSSSWQDQGFFELGADKLLGNQGYAQYGLDNLTFGGTGVSIPSAIIGAFNGTGLINGTSFLLGLFGLGVIPGSFNNTSPLSAVSALVEQVGAIPSHSWGYTAGAKYQQKGVVNSLTLGGYDSTRFVPHNISFNLDAGKQLLTFVDSISISASASSNNWTKSVELLSPTDQVSATIDSSTPYLWFPPVVCDRFAESLGLTYNDSLNLYTFDGNASQHDALAASELSFTFSLSDVSSTPSTVNITLPYAAFDLQLTYPAIPSTEFGDADATKYYFPLRKAGSISQYTIGRAFLQEAYLITDYERNTFSVHQAVHPTDSVGNTSIISILPPAGSTLSGNPAKQKSPLSAGAIAGIVVGAVAMLAILATAILFFLRRRNQKDKPSSSSSEKPFSLQSPPGSLALLPRALHREHAPLPIYEASGSSIYATEVSADATHERFELAANLGPAELEASPVDSLSGTDDTAGLSAYEYARRRLEQQQQAHAQCSTSTPLPIEKSYADVAPVPHYRATGPDPMLESPLASTQPDTASHPPTYMRFNPTSVVYAGQLPDNVQLPSTIPHVIGRNGRTSLSHSDVSGPSPITSSTRTTDNPLGNHFTAHQSSDLYGSGNSTHIVSPVASDDSGSGASYGKIDTVSSLDSKSTTNTNKGGSGRQDTTPSRNLSVLDQCGSRERLDGEDLIHVPQVADRFSWEEERISAPEGRRE